MKPFIGRRVVVRTTAALNLYREMEQELPWLLRRGGSGDDYQLLRTDIIDLIDEPPNPALPAD